MTLRKGHGAGAGVPRIEVLPADELPSPLPAPLTAPAEQVLRRKDGTIAGSVSARLLGSRGGLAKATKKKLLQGLGLADLAETDDFHVYYKAVTAWVEAHLTVLAGMCGGAVGPGPGSIVGTAGVQLAASRFYSDLAMKNPAASMSLFVTASRLGEASRQSLLAAYELGRREGEARKNATVDPYAALLEAAKEDDE